MNNFFKRLKSRTRFEVACFLSFIIPLAFATNKSAPILTCFLFGVGVAIVMWIFVLLSNFKK